MRVVVLALQEQTRLRQAGLLAVKESEIDVDDPGLASAEGFAVDIDDPEGDARRAVVAESAWQLLVALLTGATVTRASLEEMRERCGEDALLVATGGITSALLSLPGLDDRDVSAVARARADARQLVTAPADVAATPALAAASAAALRASSSSPPTGSSTAATTVPGPAEAPAASAATSAPRARQDDVEPGEPTMQRAIARVVGAAFSAAEEPSHAPAVDGRALAVLRARAYTASAARSLQGVAARALGPLPLRILEHAADELVIGAGVSHDAGRDGSAVDDAVTVLVRGAAAVASSLPDGAAIGFAVVVVGADGDVVDAMVRAASLAPRAGLLAFDDDAWRRAGELAETPGERRAVEARTPWGVDRWQLSASLPRPAFLGRQDDVGACAAVLGKGDGDETGRPRLLVVVGPPGSGKASLVRRALQEVRVWDERAVVLWGAADAQPSTPYASFLAMMRALARAPAGHPRAAARVHRLVDGLADGLGHDEAAELRSLAATLIDLLGAGTGDDLVADPSPRALRAAIRRAALLLVRALRARAGDGRPATVVVSNAEELDAPTRDILLFVARQLGGALRVVLLAAQRPRLPAAFEDQFDVTRREIGPLDAQAAWAVACELLGENVVLSESGAVDGETAELLHDAHALPRALAVLCERAKGSPLFLTHGVRWAVEGGLLQKKADVWGSGIEHWDATRFAEATTAGRMPARLDKLLQARVLRLPQAARQVLSHCAALGSTFTTSVVVFVGTRLDLAGSAVRDALRLLVATGFLSHSRPRPGAPVFIDEADDDDALLSFEHPVLRSAAVQSMTHDEAVAVHGVVALALENLLDPRAIAPLLARHHRLAERRRTSLQHLIVAARRARRLDDRVGGLALAREGLDLCLPDEHETTFSLQLEMCAVLEPQAALGERQQAELKDALRHLVRVAERTGVDRHVATALARVSRFHLFSGDVERAEENAVRALERARAATKAAHGDVAHGDEAHAASVEVERAVRDVLRLLALVCFTRHDIDGARRALDEARRRTRPDERRVLGVIEHQTALFLLESNDPLLALEHLLSACAHKRTVGDVVGEAACVDTAADVYVRTGRLWMALQLLERALALREQQGDDAGVALGRKNRAEVLLLCGDIEGAVADAGRSRALARLLGLERLERAAAIVVARAELARDDANAAEAVLDNMRRRVDDGRDPFAAMEVELLSARAKWLRAQRAVGAARERLLKTADVRARAAVVLGEQRGFLSGQVLGNALLGDVLTSSGDAGLALPYALRAVEMLDERSGSGLPVEDVLAAVARVQRAVGDEEEARAAERRACLLLEERARDLPVEQRARFWEVPARRALLDVVDGGQVGSPSDVLATSSAG